MFYKELKNISNSILLLQKDIDVLYKNDKTDLNCREFRDMMDILERSKECIKKLMEKYGNYYRVKNEVLLNNVFLIHSFEDADLDLTKPTGLYNQQEFDNVNSAASYFYSFINPDVSPVGFLETLGKLITKFKKENVFISYTNQSQFHYGRVIAEYLAENEKDSVKVK